MVLMLDEDQSFSLTANVTSPGPQRVVLSGFIKKIKGGETWIAPLLPQLFYGADGNVLTTWRQNLTTTGSQVILSRSGGLPTLPPEDLYWRKVASKTPVEEKKEDIVAEKKTALGEPSNVPLIVGAIGLGAVIGLTIGYAATRKKKRS